MLVLQLSVRVLVSVVVVVVPVFFCRSLLLLVVVPERPELKPSSHGRKMVKFGRPASEIEGLVVASGLSPLITCSLDTGDRGLIITEPDMEELINKTQFSPQIILTSSRRLGGSTEESHFLSSTAVILLPRTKVRDHHMYQSHGTKIARGCYKTSSFHLPNREVTITLDDVASLLHFPVVGSFHSFELLHVDDAVEMLVELLEVSAAKARVETIQCHGSYVRLLWMRDLYELKIKALQTYLLYLLGCTLFANKSVTYVHVVFLDALRDLTQSAGYAWGAAALCWIYEHFPSVAFAVATEDYDERRPRACHWTSGKALPVSTYQRRLDRLTLDAVCWISWGPLTVIHRLERVTRQFGYIQTIPPHHIVSSLSAAEIDDRWMQFGDYIAPVGQLCAVPDHCLLDYLDWFYMISHPFMSLTQPRDPPRVSPHDFTAIADRLDRLLNLRILTKGTKAYTVVEECVSIARCYIGQPTVAHRSRRRRHTDGH
ncbi:Protein MAIN-LIKE 1 [Glycine soja]